MHENSTVDCEECGADVPDGLDLCPHCGTQFDVTTVTSTETLPGQSPESPAQTRQAEDDNTDDRTTDRPTKENPTAENDVNTDAQGGEKTGSRFGFAAVFGAVGAMFLLIPIFLVDSATMTASLQLFGETEATTGIQPRRVRPGQIMAVRLTMISGVLCLFAAALRLSGVRFAVSRVAGALGSSIGIIGIIMIFIM